MTLFQAFGQFAGQAAAAPAVASAWVIVTPTSISNTGGSATINSSGSITMSGNTVLNVNGVFSADYKDYIIVWYGSTTSNTMQEGRLRVGGVDASGSDYTVRDFGASSTTLDTRIFTRTLWRIGDKGLDPAIAVIYVYQPFIAAPTGIRVVGGNFPSTDNPDINDYACHHDLSTSYDGFSWLSANANTGTLTVIGKKN